MDMRLMKMWRRQDQVLQNQSLKEDGALRSIFELEEKVFEDQMIFSLDFRIWFEVNKSVFCWEMDLFCFWISFRVACDQDFLPTILFPSGVLHDQEYNPFSIFILHILSRVVHLGAGSPTKKKKVICMLQYYKTGFWKSEWWLGW